MTEVPRIIRTAHDGTALGDLDPAAIAEIIAVAEVNGENYLSITTTEELSKGDRLLWRDGMETWHEYVVEGDEATHGLGETLHTYHCPWSVQHDLAGTFVSSMPGTGGTPVTASAALEAALAGTARWEVGTVDVTTTGSASFWRSSGWEALKTLVETWGGEVEADITVGLDGVTARAVSLLRHVGETEAARRFDYGGDISEIRRTVLDDTWTARVLPLGAPQETAGGGYGRKITIADANGGVTWLQDDDAVALTRLPNGNGGWEIPIQIVENETITDPATLKEWATEHLSEWTQPRVSYEGTLVQLEGAGMGTQGVAAGDECAVVDSKFGATPIRITTRLLRLEENLLDRSQSLLTFSNVAGSLGGQLAEIARSVASVQAQVTNTALNQSGSDYMTELLERLNAEANATGGYTYVTEGQGLRTYDVAVTDPLVGAEASQVVEVKGGSVRIANSKDSAGNWEWQTVATGAGIVGDSITSGTIDALLVAITNLLRIGYEAGANVAITDGKVQFTLPYDDGEGHTGTVEASMYPEYGSYTNAHGYTFTVPVFHITHGTTDLRLYRGGRAAIDSDISAANIEATETINALDEITVGDLTALTRRISLAGSTVTAYDYDGSPELHAQNTSGDVSLKVTTANKGVYDHTNSKWLVYSGSDGVTIANNLKASAGGSSASANNYWTLINGTTGLGVRFLLNPNTLNLVALYTTDGGATWSGTKTIASWS